MKKSTQGFVFALVAVPLIVGCKKKETTTTTEGSAAATGSGSAAPMGSAGSAATQPAAGSGSAVADGSGSAGSAAGSGSAKPAEPAAPWAADSTPVPATSKVTGKRNGNDEGTFDRAVYYKVTDNYGSTSYKIEITSNCEKFSCAHLTVQNGGIYTDSDKLYADCPSAKTMDIRLNLEADPKAGPVETSISINGPSSGGDLSGGDVKGSSFKSVTDKEIKGTIALVDGNSEAKGDFVAKVCGSIVFPKK